MSDSSIEQYILEHSDEESQLLKELNRETHLNVLNPRMISGALQGKLLEMISSMISPERILEIGTFTGYSAICLAKGLKKNGRLHTIEINDELKPVILKYISKAGMNTSIILHIGDALSIIPQLNETFDLVFIDGDKREYCKYFDLIIDKVKAGGFILADNILWNGKIFKDVSPKDDQTAGILQFNDKIKKDPRISRLILPVRDGLMIIRKND